MLAVMCNLLDGIMKINKVLVIALIYLLIFSYSALAKTDLSLEKAELEKRVVTLENKANEAKALKSYKEKMLEDHKQALEKMEQNLIKEVQLAKEKLEVQNKQDKLFITLMISIITVGGLFYLIYMKKLASSRIVKEMAEQFNVETKELKRLLTSLTEDYDLKKKKRILVVSPEYTDETAIKNYLEDMGFKNLRFEKFNQNNDLEGCDIVLFNDHDWGNSTETNKISKEEILNFLISSNKNDLIRFYFGPEQIHFPEKLKYLYAATNFRSQLNGNLMNALRFQDKL